MIWKFYRFVRKVSYVNSCGKHSFFYAALWFCSAHRTERKIDRHVCWNKQSSITVYRFPTKVNKLPFSVSSKQTEVCHFCFPFAANEQNSGNMEAWHGDMATWRHRVGDMVTWRHRNMEKWRHGDMETRRYGDMEKWRHGDMETSHGRQKTEAEVIFLDLLIVCSSCKQKFIICTFVDEETNGSYLRPKWT